MHCDKNVSLQSTALETNKTRHVNTMIYMKSVNLGKPCGYAMCYVVSAQRQRTG